MSLKELNKRREVFSLSQFLGIGFLAGITLYGRIWAARSTTKI